jgi:hypothetical protein
LKGEAALDLADKRLTGILINPGRHVAIFAVKDARPLIVGEGEAVSSWRIASISPREVALSGPAGDKTLRLQALRRRLRDPRPSCRSVARIRIPCRHRPR